MGTLTLLFLGLIYAWSIFRTPIGELFPDWSISQLSLTFTISMIFFCLGGFAGGLMSKKFSVRVRFLISAVMLFIGFFAVSTSYSRMPTAPEPVVEAPAEVRGVPALTRPGVPEGSATLMGIA